MFIVKNYLRKSRLGQAINPKGSFSLINATLPLNKRAYRIFESTCDAKLAVALGQRQKNATFHLRDLTATIH